LKDGVEGCGVVSDGSLVETRDGVCSPTEGFCARVRGIMFVGDRLFVSGVAKSLAGRYAFNRSSSFSVYVMFRCDTCT
jgi:hypothetical protein